MLEKQRTIREPVTISGVGLHTGNKSNMTFKPAPEDYGIRFVRIDMEGNPEIPADIDHVIDISRGTTIAKDGAEVHTVEHVLASIVGCEIDNIAVELDSNEPPVMDGSAMHYVEALKRAGAIDQEAKRDYLVIADLVHYHDEKNNVDIVGLPLKDDFRVSVMIDFNNPALGVQHTGLFDLQKEFETEFAPSSKEASPEELEGIKKKLGIEGSVILGSTGILDNRQLRYKNEPARHKLLDLIGDLALIGAPVKGQILAARPGHRSNVEFTKMLRKLYLQQKIETKFQVMKSENCVFDIEAIMEIMPHRYPFLLVDKVIDIEINHRIVGIKNVTYNEPFFNGHFPTRRVMPGVLIVEAMAQCGFILLLNTIENPEKKMAYFAAIEKVKFRKPVVPGDQLVFEMFLLSYKRGICKIAGKAYKNFLGGELACEGEFMAAVVDR